MNVITIEEQAFYELVNRLLSELREQQKTPDKWLSPQEAMDLLKIKSPTTLQKLRDEGHIRYSQPMTKVILYDRDSILAYIEKHAKNTF